MIHYLQGGKSIKKDQSGVKAFILECSRCIYATPIVHVIDYN